MSRLFFEVQQITRPYETRMVISTVQYRFPSTILFQNGYKIILTTDSETKNPCAIVEKNNQEIHRLNLNDEIPITDTLLLRNQIVTRALILKKIITD